MTSVRHPRATGTVEFTDGTSAGRDSAAESPLGRATLAALRAAPLLDGGPWHWRLHDGVAELWTDRLQPPEATDPLPLLAGGTVLHRTRIALAAAGWHSTIDRLPDPARPDFLALLRLADRRPTRAADAQIYRAVLSAHPAGEVCHPVGAAGHPAGAPGQPAGVGPLRQCAGGLGQPVGVAGAPVRPSTLYRLRDTAERSGAGLALLPVDGPGGQVPVGALGVPTGRLASHAVLYACSATARDCLLAGEALSALTVTAAVRDATTVADSAPLVAPAARHALAGLLPTGTYPLLLLHITARRV